MVKRDRSQRFGKLISQEDAISEGQYMPWARTQSPGSVKQVVFHADSRRQVVVRVCPVCCWLMHFVAEST